MSISNLLFFLMLVMGPVISISASSWVVCWAGMEIGFLGLIPLLFLGGSSLSKESSLKYFCIQALASALILVGGMMSFTFLSLNSAFSFFLMMGIVLKLALFPGHFWVTSVVFGLEWVSICFILGPLKVPPLAFLSELVSLMPKLTSWVLMLCGLSAVIGGILGNNQTNIRAMLGASSIAHSGWLGTGCVFGGVWLYLSFYLMVLFSAMLFLWQGEVFLGSMGVLSLSGLPPFVMFIAKLKVVQCVLMSPDSFVWLIGPLLGALLSLSFYLKFFYSLLLTTTRQPSQFSGLLFFIVNVVGVGWIFLFFFLSGRDLSL